LRRFGRTGPAIIAVITVSGGTRCIQVRDRSEGDQDIQFDEVLARALRSAQDMPRQILIRRFESVCDKVDLASAGLSSTSGAKLAPPPSFPVARCSSPVILDVSLSSWTISPRLRVDSWWQFAGISVIPKPRRQTFPPRHDGRLCSVTTRGRVVASRAP
jgi:hypothetical protein